MRNQLDWQAGDDDGGWEIISAIEVRAPRKRRWRLWGTLLTTLVLLAAGGGFAVRGWYDAVLARIASQIQEVMDQEAQALADGDTKDYLAQQDVTSPAQLDRQAKQALVECPGTDAQGSFEALYACLPDARVEGVEVRGDTAWVEVVTELQPVRQVRFYRRTERGWKHTAPDGTFWGDPVQLDYGLLTVRCYERDLPHIEPLVERMLQAYETYAVLVGSGLEIRFAAEVPAARLPNVSGHTLTLPSPWLTGIPLEEKWEEGYLEDLAKWVGYAGERILTSGA